MNSKVKHKAIYLVNKEKIWSHSNIAVFSGESDSESQWCLPHIIDESSIKGAPRLVMEEDTLLMLLIALKMTFEPY